MISIVIPDLRFGGAERVAVNLGNEWSRRGYEVEFVLMDAQGEFLSQVAPGISIYNLHATRLRHVPKCLNAYFRERKPMVTLAHMWPLTSIASFAWCFAGSPGQLFLCEHTNLSEHATKDLSIPLWLVTGMLRASHSIATGLVAVSHGAASDLAQLMRFPEPSIRVIHNPIVAAELHPRRPLDPVLRQRLWQGAFSRTIISISTLISLKNHLLLLEAFAELSDELNAGLVILGEGPMRPILEKRIYELGLQKRVQLPGFHLDPEVWLRAADLFVLTSDYEGFGNVIVEALAAGTPVVSTACPYGPEEILDRGRYGVLTPVGDRKALSLAIRTALSRSWDPSALQRRALDFSVPKQASAYLDLFGLPRF